MGVAGFWVLASGDTLGMEFTSSFDLRLGVDGLSGLFLGTLGLIAAPALVFSLRYLEPSRRGRVTARSPRGSFSRSRSSSAPGSADLPHGLGADDAAVSHGDPRRAQGGQAVAADGVQLPRSHPPRRGGHLGCNSAAGEAEAIGDPAAIGSGSGLQIAIALAALVGIGTKAGVMPLHVWLPRAQPSRQPGLGADERGDDQGGAVRVVRVLGSGLRPPGLVRRARARRRRALCRRRRLYALFQHDLKRLLALHSIENVGIIVLGLGACLILPLAVPTLGRVRTRRRAPAHRQPRGLQGAALPRRGRVRAGGGLTRARPARWPAAPHAVDGGRVPGRGDGDRRSAPPERLCLGMADLPGAAARMSAGSRGRRGLCD